MTSSIEPFCVLGKNNQNEVQHDFIGYVTRLELASCGANGFINRIIAFVRSGQSNGVQHYCFQSFDTTSASHDADGIASDIMTFVRLR